MIGIYWKYKDYEKSEKYWGLTSIQYKYLNHILLDFEFKFNQSICEKTNEFSILEEQKTFLLNETKTELEKLLVYFDKKQTGVNSITKIYNGISYKLYYKSSKQHKLISRLISFYEYLEYSLENNVDLICGGIENESKN